MSNKYMHGERQKSLAIDAGIALWRDKGESAVSARGIGKEMGLSHAGVLFHFDGIDDLKKQVKARAIETGETKIIQQMLVADDPAVAHFTPEQRSAWLNAS